jgi:hypothetical protein
MSPGLGIDRYIEEEMQAISGKKGSIREPTLDASQSQNLILKNSLKGG